MRLLICAGGTGGGVYPALSVLQALKLGTRTESEVTMLWVGGEKGMEAELVERAGVPYRAIPAAGVHGVGLRSMPGNLLQLGKGFLAARRLLDQFRPEVLFFTGGYVAVPVALAARLPQRSLQRPRSLVFIPDIEPGWALKFLVRFSDQLALTTEDSRSYVPASIQAEITGYPVRADLQRWDRSEARRTLNLGVGQPILTILGGSKGARSINQAVFKAIPELLAFIQVVHITGQSDWDTAEAIRQQLPEHVRIGYHPYAYLHEEIGAALAAADLVLSRAGASILGELPLFGTPAILVPYPYAWRYQQVNANYLVQRGAAVLVNDADLPEKIVSVVRDLMSDPGGRNRMGAAMKALAKPQAAADIANLLTRLVPSMAR